MERQEWFTASEAADFLRVTRSTIYRWARASHLRYHLLPEGTGRRFHRSDLEAVLRSADQRSGEEKG